MTIRPSTVPVGRLVALALVAGGALLMVVSVFADQLQLSGGGAGFGWKQLIAAIAGLVMLLIGLAWLLQPFAEADEDVGEPLEPAEPTE